MPPERSAVADRTAAAAPLVAALAARAPRMHAERVAGIWCVDLAVGTPWSRQVFVVEEPQPAAVGASRAWLDARGGGTVLTRETYAGDPAFAGLPVADTLPVLVTGATTEELRATALHRAGSAQIRAAADAAEFAAAYGTGFDEPALARALVAPEHLGRPDWLHLVATVDGELCGSGMVRVAEETACVSGVGVSPAARGRGLGAALTLACAVAGRDAGADLVWLHAAHTALGLYEHLGFERVDTHVQLRADPATVAG